MNDALVTPDMIFAGLVGAIQWNLVAWLLGLPSSSSHALIGAVSIGAGVSGVNFSVVRSEIVLRAVVAPVVGYRFASPPTDPARLDAGTYCQSAMGHPHDAVNGSESRLHHADNCGVSGVARSNRDATGLHCPGVAWPLDVHLRVVGCQSVAGTCLRPSARRPHPAVR